MPNTYDVGDLIRVTATFRDADEELDSPDTVTMKVKAPGGTVATSTPGADSPGVFHVDIDCNASGDWEYRAEGDASPQAAAEGRFYVRPSSFA